MKRQGMAIDLRTVKWLEKTIKKELRDLKSLGILGDAANKDKLGVMFVIINHPTVGRKRAVYCSDTWQFEEGT